MEIQTQIILSVTLYKTLSLLIGLAFSYMGFRIFMAGIWGDAGNLETKFENTKLVVKNAAPGTFFALFGALIVSFTIFKGMAYDSIQFEPKKNDNSSTLSKLEFPKAQKELPDELPF